MKNTSIVAAIIAALVSFPIASLAQYGQGGSPHCDAMSGAAKDQCLKDEAAKTDKGASNAAPSGAAAGASPSTAASRQYGQGGSPRCDAMSGADKEQCLKDEAAKTDSKGSSEKPAK